MPYRKTYEIPLEFVDINKLLLSGEDIMSLLQRHCYK